MTSPSRPRSTRRVLAVAVGAVLLLTACDSNPSAKRIAQDLVNTLATSESQRTCMLEVIETYGNDQLEEIARNADQVSQNVGDLSPLDQFEADLEACG